MIDTREYISNLAMPEKVTLFKELYDELAGCGTNGDTELAHVNTFEASLLKSLGGSGTINDITGLREYGGGGGDPAPPTQTSTTQTSEFPTELKPFIKDILTEGQTEFEREKEEGFQAFPGPQLAAFTPEQQAAFTAGREQFTGLAGTPLGQASTYYAPALASTALGTSEIGTADIQRRMDPFLQNVVDIAKREARRDEESAVQQRAAQAVGAGSFGGSRQALVESEAERNLGERLADIQARGLSASFQNAQQAAEAQRAREMTGGRQFAALGDITGARARGDISGLAGIGETQQQRSQQALDIAEREFQQERAFPQAALQRYASLIRGFPLQATQQQFSTQTVPTPSFAQTLAGVGQTGLGAYGMFGGFKPNKEGGLVSLQGGGQPGAQYAMGNIGGPFTTPMPRQDQFPQASNALEMLRRRGAAIRQASVPQAPQTAMPVGRQNPFVSRNEGGLMSVVNRQNGDLLSLTPMEDLQLSMKRQEPLHARALEQILAQPSREKLLQESREHWRKAQERADERLQRADELQKKKFWAGLIASGAGTMAADPRKGVWGAVGEGFQAGLPTWMEGMSEYAEAEERAAEREEDIVEAGRGEELTLNKHDLENTLQQLKLMQMQTSNKTEYAQIQATIDKTRAELARWSFAYTYPQLDAPDTSGLLSQMEREYYGDKASPGEQKELVNILNEAWRNVDAKLEALWHEDPQATMPGENQLIKDIEDEYRRLARKREIEVIVGFDEETGKYVKGPVSEHSPISTKEAIEGMEEYMAIRDKPDEKGSTVDWLQKVSPFSYP
jgi:hypothetical protein